MTEFEEGDRVQYKKEGDFIFEGIIQKILRGSESIQQFDEKSSNPLHETTPRYVQYTKLLMCIFTFVDNRGSGFAYL